MINDEDDQMNDEVNSATMRKLAFEKMDDDYYLGSGAVGDDVLDSDDDLSSDDEVKSTLRKLAGYDEKKKEVSKDAFGRQRRRSEFEDDMDDELDRSITEYANEHMGAASCKIEEMMEQDDEDDELEKALNRQATQKWADQNDEIERRMAALEMLPYDVDLTDSEIDAEMPAAVVKDKTGQAIKLVYSCKRGQKFDVDDRRRRQKERRRRVAEANRPAKQRQTELVKSIVDGFKANEMATSATKVEKKYEPGTSSQMPLASILKKRRKISEKMEEEDEKEKEEDKDNEEEETNPIKKSLKEREKEIAQNDELLYDDQEDEDNEKWVKERRKEARGSDGPGISEADGVLSCPGCMVELTRDCQRHEIYKTQYRAMFVSNCQLDDQKMMIEKTGKDKRREKQKAKKLKEPQQQADVPPSTIADRDLFTPVKCASCGTTVAMMDHDEVYHFFNVLSGYS